MILSLTIQLGNDAMQTGEDAADALRDVSSQLDQGFDEGNIRDTNGNRVGDWHIS